MSCQMGNNKLNNSNLVKRMKWGIKKDTYVPLYQQVKDAIYNKIIEGSWAPGELIPSDRTLSEEMGVSRITVIRALKELTDDGILRRERSCGTFVAEQNHIDNNKRVGVVIHQAELFVDSFFNDIFLGIKQTAACVFG